MLRQRSNEGFTYLYDHYSGALLGIILGFVHNSETAQDILQDVFLNIFRKIDGYDTKFRLYTWMASIARNLSVDVVRSKGYRNSKLNQEIISLVDKQSPFTTIHTDHIGLRGFCMKLKPKYWEVIWLSYFHGYTNVEISSLLGMPVGTVKTRLKTALVQLRDLMRENAQKNPMNMNFLFNIPVVETEIHIG